MPHRLHVGSHVWADFGNGYVLAHVVAVAHENPAGETRWGIQDPNGSRVDMAYRETADLDAAGSGLTFKLT